MQNNKKAVIGDCTLHYADSLPLLWRMKSDSVDAVFGDPPYSSGGLHSGDRKAAPSKKYQVQEYRHRYKDFAGDNRDQHSFQKWAYMWLTECLPGSFTYPVVGAKKQHMTEKPVPLMVDLLAIVPEDGIVLDPFAGSGTTGVACIERGLRFIGVEKEEHYFEVASNRLKQAYETHLKAV